MLTVHLEVTFNPTRIRWHASYMTTKWWTW